MTNATRRGKPDAGNPHVRFDEGEVAPVKPGRGSLLYMKKSIVFVGLVLSCGTVLAVETNRVIIQPYSATMGGYYTVSVDGGAAVSGTTYVTNDVPVGSSLTVTLAANKNRQFLYWCRGVDPSQARLASFTFTPTGDRTLVPLVRSSIADPCTRTWINGNSYSEKKDRPWYVDSYWSPSGVPGPDDDVVFNTAVATYGYDFIAVKSLTVGAAARIRVGVGNGGASKYVTDDVDSSYLTPFTTGGHGDIAFDASGDVVLTNGCQMGIGCVNNETFAPTLKVGGNLTVAHDAKLCVFAGATNDVRSLASGAGFITVGGKLKVSDGGVIKPYSEPYTGGSIKITAATVEILGTGSVNADNCGYRKILSRTPMTCCPGDYSSYGGTAYNGTTTYGFLASPVHPGSGNSYSDNSYNYRGGGLIRIHASGSFTLSGTLSAEGMKTSSMVGYAGFGSGGGIWVTARDFVFGEGATASAASSGAATSAAYGAGGRIAFSTVTDASVLASFAQTGEVAGCRVWTLARFRKVYGETLSVNLSHGTSRDKSDDRAQCNGTFAWVPKPKGMMLLFR